MLHLTSYSFYQYKKYITKFVNINCSYIVKTYLINYLILHP